MLHQDIKGEIKVAMLAKDTEKLGVVRGLVAAFTNELLAKKKKPDEFLTDEEVFTVISREAKKRKDSIEQFRAGGREDLAASEAAELKLIEKYLPAQMSEIEIETAAQAKATELGVTTKADAGKLMQALMKDLKGKADGSLVKAAVEKILK